MKTRYVILLGALLVFPGTCHMFAEGAPRPDAVVAFDQRNQQRAEKSTNLLVRPGLVADRVAGEVHILAQSSGIRESDPVEFVLIAPKSGHDYESLAVALCTPSAVYEALEFLGVKAGRPVDPGKLVFWPKGERIRIEVACRSTNLWAGRIAAEMLVKNAKAVSPMVTSGFVFSGSRWIKDAAGRSYVPDLSEPHAIVSLYNEPATVLDVPRLAQQNTLYDTLFPNPEFSATTNVLLDFFLQPDSGRTMDLTMNIVHVSSNATVLGDVSCMISAPPGSSAFEPLVVPLSGAVSRFSELVGEGKDVFVHLDFAAALPVALVRQVCVIVGEIEGEAGIRIEPPQGAQLYYKAFIADERHRNREERISQPWELRLYPESSGKTNVLTQIKEIWKDDQVKPDLEPIDHPVENPEDLRAKLDSLGPGLPVVLVYVPPGLSHGKLLSFLNPVLPTHGIIHVYLEDE